MAFENLLIEIKDSVYVITINRPDKLNALNISTIREIGEAVADAAKNESVRVIILTGAGPKAFVAGADISEFSSFTEAEGAALARHGHNVFNSIENCPKPVIAAINGFALGGGCELAMSCHLRVASDNARFGQPEPKLGLTPGYGGTQRLPQLIGKVRALEYLMTSDMMNAEQALQYGLLNYVTTPDNLMLKCMEIADKLIQMAPVALAGIIRSVNAHYDKNSNGFDQEITEFGKCFITEDFSEGTQAFLQKRKANFKGR